MKIRSLTKVIASIAALALFGCGGGGGSAPPAGSVTVSGAAVKGPVNGGDVTVYAVVNGVVNRTAPLITGKTAADGSYTLTIPPEKAPSGPIVVEVTGGTYTDEATGTPNVALSSTLTAIVSSAANGDKISISPLTQLAFQKAAGTGSLTVSAIDDANLKIGQTFGVSSIIRSTPFDATQTTAPASASADDKKYAAAVGVISQMVKNNIGTGTVTKETVAAGLTSLLTTLGAEVRDNGGFSPTTATNMGTALTAFSAINKSGTVPQTISFQSGVLTLATTGTIPQGTGINGIDLTVTLPANVTVNANGVTGELAADTVIASGQAAGANSFISGKFTPASGGNPATVRLIIANVQPGFAVGEFARLNLNTFVNGTYAISGPPGKTAPDISGSTSSGATPVTLSTLSVSGTLSGL